MKKLNHQSFANKIDLSKKKIANISILDSLVTSVGTLKVLDLSQNKIEAIDIEKLGSVEGVFVFVFGANL